MEAQMARLHAPEFKTSMRCIHEGEMGWLGIWMIPADGDDRVEVRVFHRVDPSEAPLAMVWSAEITPLDTSAPQAEVLRENPEDLPGFLFFLFCLAGSLAITIAHLIYLWR